MQITPYLRTLEEYKDKEGQTVFTECSWSNGIWKLQNELDQFSLNTDTTRLEDIIWVRQEEGFGFVSNDINELVFYADKEALDLIEASLNETLENIRNQNPQLLRSLHVQ